MLLGRQCILHLTMFEMCTFWSSSILDFLWKIHWPPIHQEFSVMVFVTTVTTHKVLFSKWREVVIPSGVFDWLNVWASWCYCQWTVFSSLQLRCGSVHSRWWVVVSLVAWVWVATVSVVRRVSHRMLIGGNRLVMIECCWDEPFLENVQSYLSLFLSCAEEVGSAIVSVTATRLCWRVDSLQ